MIHSVIQVVPTDDFKVYIYFDSGEIKLFDMKHMLNKGVFKQISNIEAFKSKCTVMNGTLAWDISGNFDEYNCLDIDPETIYINGVNVEDPLSRSAA